MVLERSILSSAAFHYVRYRSTPRWFAVASKALNEFASLQILFLVYNQATFRQHSVLIKDRSIRRVIVARGERVFYRKYLQFFKEIVPRFINAKVCCVKVSNKSSESSIIRKYFNDLPHN